MKRFAAFVVAIFVVFSLASLASAQVPKYDVTVGGYVGVAIPQSTDIGVSGPGAAFTAKSVQVNPSVSVGGYADFWTTQFRAKTKLDFGAGLEFTQAYPVIDQQAVRASGMIGGNPVVGATVNPMGLDMKTIVVNFKVRHPFGVSKDRPFGKWNAFAGAGGGAEILSVTTGCGGDTVTAPVGQVLAGAEYFLTKHLGASATYKYSFSSPTFRVAGANYAAQTNGSAVLFGLAYHFGLKK
jgi:opacity protein-like surface antigen